MIEKLPVPPRNPTWMKDQNPKPEYSQSPEALGFKRFWMRRLRLWGHDVPAWSGLFHEARCLRHLWIQGSSLTLLPEDIGQLRRLRSLVILNVNLLEFPMWICEMTRLRELTVRGTNISHIPNGLSNLLNLRRVDFANNLIRRFDVDLRECQKLWSFQIGDNDLEELPSKFPANTGMALAGTPFREYTGRLFKEMPSD